MTLQEHNRHRCTLAQRRLNLQPSTVLLNDAVHVGQAKPRSLRWPLRREEGFKNMFHGIVVHARAGIRHVQTNIRSGLGADATWQNVGIEEGNPGCTECNRTSIGHRIASVDTEVHQCLLNPPWIDHHRRDIGLNRNLEVDLTPTSMTDQVDCVIDEHLEVHPFRSEGMASTEGQQLLCQACTTAGTTNDAVKVRNEFFVEVCTLLQDSGVATDNRENVVEIVCHTASEFAQCFHTLVVQELFLELALTSQVLEIDGVGRGADLDVNTPYREQGQHPPSVY